MANAKNLASGRLYQNISASTTTILVYVGSGSATTIKNVWPSVPFYATISPSSPEAGSANSLDSEIVKVTAVGNDQVGNTSLTVVRGQRGISAKAFSAGAIVTHAIYAEDAVFADDPTTQEPETPWVTASMIVWSGIMDKIYPVGSIYMSSTLSTEEQVEEVFGGTWVAWGAGRVPVGVDVSQTEFNTANKTGGSKYLQSHTHYSINYTNGYSGGSQSGYQTLLAGNQTTGTPQAVKTAGQGDSENLQPYITCYMYKRTS